MSGASRSVSAAQGTVMTGRPGPNWPSAKWISTPSALGDPVGEVLSAGLIAGQIGHRVAAAVTVDRRPDRPGLIGKPFQACIFVAEQSGQGEGFRGAAVDDDRGHIPDRVCGAGGVVDADEYVADRGWPKCHGRRDVVVPGCVRGCVGAGLVDELLGGGDAGTVKHGDHRGIAGPVVLPRESCGPGMPVTVSVRGGPVSGVLFARGRSGRSTRRN